MPAPCAQEIHALKHGLAGRLRLAAIPTALAMVETLTTPYRARHPDVQFTVYSRTSIEILTLLENLEIDAGLTYLDNEPLGRVTAVPLYRERYRLLVAADAPLGDRETVTWAEVAQGAALPADAGHAEPPHHRAAAARRRRRAAHHARIGFDDSAVFARAHRPLGKRDAGAAGRDARPHRRVARRSRSSSRKSAHTIGLVAPAREPMTPLTAALVAEARRVAASLDD